MKDLTLKKLIRPQIKNGSTGEYVCSCCGEDLRVVGDEIAYSIGFHAMREICKNCGADHFYVAEETRLKKWQHNPNCKPHFRQVSFTWGLDIGHITHWITCECGSEFSYKMPLMLPRKMNEKREMILDFLCIKKIYR